MQRYIPTSLLARSCVVGTYEDMAGAAGREARSWSSKCSPRCSPVRRRHRKHLWRSKGRGKGGLIRSLGFADTHAYARTVTARSCCTAWELYSTSCDNLQENRVWKTTCVWPNHFAAHQKLTQHRKSTTLRTLSRVRLCDPVDCSPPGSSVHGTLQAGILQWVAISFSRRSSWPGDQTQVSRISCFGRQVLYH